MEATPFNVGERIALRDFTPEEAAAFAAGLGEGGKPTGRAGRGGEAWAMAVRLAQTSPILWGGRDYLTLLESRMVARAVALAGRGEYKAGADLLVRTMRSTHVLQDQILRAVSLYGLADDPAGLGQYAT